MMAGCASTGQHVTKHSWPVPKYDARTFFETTSLGGASFSHDESRILMSSDATGVFNVYSQPATGGEPTMLTNSASESLFAVRYFPDDDRVLYRADKGGNERTHVYVREVDGSVRDLTPGDEVRASFAGFSEDRKSFWITTNERDPKHMDLYRFATDGYARELVFTNLEGWDVSDVSRDGRWIALTKVRTNADNDVFVWDTTNPEAEPVLVTSHEGNVNHGVLTFTPDGAELYYTTDEHGEFAQAWSVSLEDRSHKLVVQANWDVSNVTFSEKGRYRVTATNEDAKTVVRIFDTRTNRNVRLPQLPAGEIQNVRFSPSDSKMAFYASSDRSPPNLYVLDMNSGGFQRLTDSINPAIKSSHLVDGVVVRYQSFDGLEIPALLYRPRGSSGENKAPGLVWVHGGPGGQSRLRYNAALQHLVNHGYAVLAVNNRGSSGYGKTFFHLDDRRHGEDDLQDCIWGRRYLESLDWIDGDSIGIFGGSYGGFMVAAALTLEPEAFDAGVNIFGVTNWVRTLTSIPPWWESFREMLYAEMGDPETDGERLHRISPLFHASNITKPLLVVQGAKDPRVLPVESDELVAAARKNGTPVEYVLFPDEGHGFRKRENRITASEAYVRFLDKYLRD